MRADADFINAQLGVDEGYLLAFVDGQATVEELCAQTSLSRQEMDQALQNLIAAKIVVEPPAQDAQADPSTPLDADDDLSDLEHASWEDESEVNHEINAVLSALEPVSPPDPDGDLFVSPPAAIAPFDDATDLVDVTSVEEVEGWEDDGGTLVGALPDLDAIMADPSTGADAERAADLFDDKTPETLFEHAPQPSSEVDAEDWDDSTPVTGMQIQPPPDELGPELDDADAIAQQIAAHDDAWQLAAAHGDASILDPLGDVEEGEFDDEPETSNIHEGTASSGSGEAIFFDGTGDDSEDEIVLFDSAVDHEFDDDDLGASQVEESQAEDRSAAAEPDVYDPAEPQTLTLEVEALQPVIEPPSREEYPFLPIELAAGLLPVEVFDFYGALPQTPWRQRVEAAAGAEGAELLAYCLDPDPDVAEAVYKNLLFGPELARFVALHQQTPEALARLGTHARFVADAQVCINLLRNPSCPESVLGLVMAGFSQQQLQQIEASPDASEQARAVAAQALGQRFAQAMPGDRCELILGSQARCLLELPGAELDEDTEELLCRARFDSAELILNLARFAGTTRRLLQILYRQPLTMETAELKDAIRQHPNWPR